jgi:hypothetical protein
LLKGQDEKHAITIDEEKPDAFAQFLWVFYNEYVNDRRSGVYDQESEPALVQSDRLGSTMRTKTSGKQSCTSHQNGISMKWENSPSAISRT